MDLTMELPENTSMSKYPIELVDGKQPVYGLIYAFSPKELETLKVYIKTYLKIRFIWLFKSSADTFIFFDKKPNGNFYLYVDYWGQNNLTIKN